MRIFIDSANVTEISQAYSLGFIDGITTNPTLLRKNKGSSIEESIQKILEVSKEGSVHVGIVGKTDEMVKQGVRFSALSSRIVIKVPATQEGFLATHKLVQSGISVNVTLIFSVNQALIAARLGANFISPFIGRLDDIDLDGLNLIRDISKLYTIHSLHTRILAASIRTPMHVTKAALYGAHIVTVPYNLLLKLFNHPLTERGYQTFENDFSLIK